MKDWRDRLRPAYKCGDDLRRRQYLLKACERKAAGKLGPKDRDRLRHVVNSDWDVQNKVLALLALGEARDAYVLAAMHGQLVGGEDPLSKIDQEGLYQVAVGGHGQSRRAAVERMRDLTLFKKLFSDPRAQMDQLTQALSLTDDPELLSDIAMSDQREQIWQAALARLSDPARIARVAQGAGRWEVRVKAYQALGDEQRAAEQVVLHDPDSANRAEAVRSVGDEGVLWQVVEKDGDGTVRMAALKRIVSPHMLARIARFGAHEEERYEAVSRVSDPDVLATVEANDDSKLVRGMAAARQGKPDRLLREALAERSLRRTKQLLDQATFDQAWAAYRQCGGSNPALVELGGDGFWNKPWKEREALFKRFVEHLRDDQVAQAFFWNCAVQYADRGHNDHVRHHDWPNSDCARGTRKNINCHTDSGSDARLPDIKFSQEAADKALFKLFLSRKARDA